MTTHIHFTPKHFASLKTYTSKTVMCLLLANCILVSGCDNTLPLASDANPQGHTAPTRLTILANQDVLTQRPFANTQDFENARRGLIAQDPQLRISNDKGDRIWDMSEYDFIDSKGQHAPHSVNPSLWRQAALNNIHGLFKVSEGIYQLRGFDLANMSIIETNEGWIIVDPLTTLETASKAFTFARQHLGKKPLKAILFTHSHMDHFGGVQGILQHLSKEENDALRIIAPAGFEEEATSENVLAGTAMSRRAMYMYGKALAKNDRGHIDTGLGKAPAWGSFGIASPTDLITETDTELTIDGLRLIFQTVSGSEAPAEFTFYLPDLKAFCGAELVSNNMHNLYTLRGAKVRDAKLWSSYIEEARKRFADAEIYFASHHWPLWGNDAIQDFLSKQRDTYKFIHDQTLRGLNRGATPTEIAETLKMPASLNTDFHNQGYYGTLSHNVKAVYQNYLGWFTANPAKLNPLPETEVAKEYIALMGGVNAVVTHAQKAFEEADSFPLNEGIRRYRWLAELLNHAVFAEPGHAQAKALLAKVYDQLGYQAESAPWRDFYLSGAYELRHGGPETGINPIVMKEVLLKTPVDLFFDNMAANLDASKAEGETLAINVSFSDLGKTYRLSLNNSVLHHDEVSPETSADASLSVTRALFVKMITGEASLEDVLFNDDLRVDGSKLDLLKFFRMIDRPEGTFNIVTP